MLAVLGAAGCATEEDFPPARTPSAPATAVWDEAAARELRAAMDRMNDAWAAGDIAAIRGSIAGDDFLISYDLDMMGTPVSFATREEILKFAEMTFARIQVRRVDCRATATFGVCVNEFDAIVTVGGKTEAFSFRGSGTFRKGADGWNGVHWHASLANRPEKPPSPAPPPPAPPPLPPMPAAATNATDLKWIDMPGIEGVRMAVAWGDPEKGAFAAMLEAKKALRVPRHVHSGANWIYVQKGEMTVTEDGGPVVTKAGGASYHSGRIPHTLAAKAGSLMYFVSEGPLEITMVDGAGNPLPPPGPPAAGGAAGK